MGNFEPRLDLPGWVPLVIVGVGMIPVVVGWFIEYRSVRKATGHYKWTLGRVALWGGLTLFSPIIGLFGVVILLLVFSLLSPLWT